MELLERAHLLADLAGHLERAAAGDGRMVLVAGEAGIGKTSLARAFCQRHEQAAEVWWGACDALTTPRPLAPLYDIARAAGGDLAAVMASHASRHDRFTAALEALVSPLRPIIAVVEDAHWADEATRDLLVYLGRRIPATNALLVTTYRDDEVGPDHPLRSVLGHLATLPGVHRLTLERLSEWAVDQLAAGRDHDPARVYRLTGGNPFYVTEILAAGPDDVPTTVTDAVFARAARLSPTARAALEAAAVVPDRAETDLVLAMSGTSQDAVEECRRQGLLQAHGRAVRFRHELARLAIAEHIPAFRLPDMHARALAFLGGRSDADPARLAYHAEAAGDRDGVLQHAPAAAAHAARLGAHHEAAVHLARAVRYAEAIPAAARIRLLERYAAACWSVGAIAEALAAAERALADCRELEDDESAARLMINRATFLWSMGRGADSRDAASESLALLAGQPATATHALVRARAAHLRMLARDVASAIALGNEAAALAEQLGDTASLAAAVSAVGSAQWFAEPDQAGSTLRRALALYSESGDEDRAAIVMVNLGSGAGEVRRYRLADDWLAATIAWCTERDLDHMRCYALAWSARSAFEQGQWSQADSVVAELTASEPEDVPSQIVGLTARGRLRVRRGDPDADAPLDEAWRLAQETGDLQRLWPVAAGRAEAAWLAGHPERIPELVEDAYQLARQLRLEWPVGELAYWLWKADALPVAPDGAAEPYALHIHGHWRRAAAVWDAIGCPYDAALARTEGGDPDQLRAALTTFANLGASPMADRVSARLRDLGARDLPRRPTRATLANPAGLTDRELEVLVLLASGATNRDIARRLHISPKTAGHHVSAILTKLDAPGRQEAVRAAVAQGIVAGR